MLKINEIFTSIQGEGYHVGRPATFIRLAGCNCRCEWCDTEFLRSTEMNDDEIITQISRHRLVIFTGGEPLLQLKELIPLIEKLKKKKHSIAVETNGTILCDFGIFDWVTMSPKDRVKGGAQHRLLFCDELKIIYEGQDLNIYNDIHATHYFLQPQHNNKESLNLCINKILEDPRWRLSLQIHKMIGVR